jgi:hypothetical protein
VMKGYEGSRIVSMAISNVMWLGINVLGWEYSGLYLRKNICLSSTSEVKNYY